MVFDHIFKGAKLVTPTGIVDADIGIYKGKIEKIGSIVNGMATREHNCEGLFILPGLIDMHVHFRDPAQVSKSEVIAEDFASGSRAAAAGGVTTIIDMPNTNPATITCEALEIKREIAKKKSIVNYGFYFGLTADNLGEIRKAKNIAGVKVFMGSSTGNLLVEDPRVIEELFKLRKFVIVHAENEALIQKNIIKYKDSEDPSVHSLIRSPQAAYEATKIILHLAKKHDAQIHITHVSTYEEVNELIKFKSPRVSADAATNHLFLTESAYKDQKNFVKINPALRLEKDKKALWTALHNGIIQAITTDHAPHLRKEKELPYSQAPSGVPGVETMLPLLLDSVNHGNLTLQELARFTAENPARLLKIKNKGRIELGYDADLAIVDMNKEMKVGEHGFFTKCGWSPYKGWNLKGWPVMTVVTGYIAYEKGEVNGTCRGKEIVL